MSMKGTTLVGLDVHAAQTQAAVLEIGSGELRVKRLPGSSREVVSFLEGLGPGVRAVYEAGPTGFGLARLARARGIAMEVVAPGSISRGSGDRVKTDRRDAVRLARLLAAGELRFAFVPSVADEQFRGLTRSIEGVRGDLMRARHVAPAGRGRRRAGCAPSASTIVVRGRPWPTTWRPSSCSLPAARPCSKRSRRRCPARARSR